VNGKSERKKQRAIINKYNRGINIEEQKDMKDEKEKNIAGKRCKKKETRGQKMENEKKRIKGEIRNIR
jgi:hypothetical protein